jgi:hypothetical protein
MPEERKIKKHPNNESQKLFPVNNINSKNVLIKKMKMEKFQENENARSTSKIKNDQTTGRNSVLISLTGNPQMTGVLPPPNVGLVFGIPA